MSALEDWLGAWREHSTSDVHPFDEVYLNTKELELFKSRRVVRSMYHHPMPPGTTIEGPRNGLFRKELGTMPFIGNIRKAHIFLCMINPGVSSGDYYDLLKKLPSTLFVENKCQELQNCFAFERNVAKGWSDYYLRMFGSLLKEFGLDEERAREFLSHNVAILELVPYYSQNISLLDQLGMDQELPTAKLARAAARELESNGDNLFITRWATGLRRWGLNKAVESVCRHGLSHDAKAALRTKIQNHLSR